MPGFKPIDRDDIEHRFTNHPPVGDTGGVLDEITAWMIDLGVHLAETLPEGPEKSTAIRKLEETSMWAKASIARNQEGSS